MKPEFKYNDVKVKKKVPACALDGRTLKKVIVWAEYQKHQGETIEEYNVADDTFGLSKRRILIRVQMEPSS